MNTQITVIVHSHNEEHTINDCIMSARHLSDNIILVDMESSDHTVDIATKLNVKVFSHPYKSYVEPARAFGVSQAQTDWVFILDADERVTQELAEEINRSIASHKQVTFFRIPRKNIFGKKKWLKHGGWWPDRQIRLIYKPAFVEWPERIHSTPVISGQMGLLNQPILHYFHGDISRMVEKTIVYEQVESELLFGASRRSDTAIFFRKFFGELYRRILKNAGFLDGSIGIIESIYQSYSKTITYLFLYEKKKSTTI